MLAFRCKRFLINILGNAGPRFKRAYLTSARKLAENEQSWLISQGIGGTDFHELISLYPSLQRILYIHIPKCGGTSIRRSLVKENKCAPVPMPDSGSINQAISFMLWSASPLSPKRRFLNRRATAQAGENLQQKYLRVFTGYCVAQAPKRIFVLGHQRASELVTFFREDRDLLFATVRAPAEILKSLVTYRVTHTLEDQLRPDSVELLDSLQLDIKAFTELASTRPQRLTELILERHQPALNAYLAFDHRKDHESVWQGIKDRSVFLAHISEQAPMIRMLLGNQPGTHRENTTASHDEISAEFNAAIRESWLEPFIDWDSMTLYKRMESSGIIGFWQNGGTVRQYLALLKSA
jgi:hypothetical protein